MPKYIDIHSHVNFNAFESDRDEVISRALEASVWHINVGTNQITSKKAVEIANKYQEGVYAIAGLHPIHTEASFHDEAELGVGGKSFTSQGEIFEKSNYLQLLKDPKVVAIGECGLDYYRMTNESADKQKKAFIEQILLSNEVNKPLMLHIRNAYKDALDILKEYSKVKGNVHFFAGTWEEAKSFLNEGYSLSFTGVITFARDYDEVVKNTPLDMIMTETDCPYLTPKPYRGRRNEPLYVSYVAEKIAEIKGIETDLVAEKVLENAKRIFKI
jgi:TatD DNase family protein